MGSDKEQDNLDREEEELQAELEKQPILPDIRDELCAYCGDSADSWVSITKVTGAVGLIAAGETRDYVPMCSECAGEYGIDDDYECWRCAAGRICPEHDEFDEDWLVAKLSHLGITVEELNELVWDEDSHEWIEDDVD